MPYAQGESAFEMTVYARTALEPEESFRAVRATVRELDVNLPVYAMRTFDAQIDRSLSTDRMIALLSTAFGLLATFVAAVGLYGVLAYTVSHRTREIGIRVALGGVPSDIAWLVLADVARMLAAGVALALPAAWALSRLVQSSSTESAGTTRSV